MEMSIVSSRLLLCALLVLGIAAFFYSYLYLQEHGGGDPEITPDGRCALNDHGQLTYVEESVYREAVRRRSLAYAAWVACFVLTAIALYRARSPRREETRR
jgi:hypothetical protein